MKPAVRQVCQWAVVVGILILAVIATPVAQGVGMDPTLRVERFLVVGNEVQVEVLNLDREAHSGTLMVYVRLSGGEMGRLASFKVLEGQKVFVRVLFAEPVADVIACGVVLDDGTPF